MRLLESKAVVIFMVVEAVLAGQVISAVLYQVRRNGYLPLLVGDHQHGFRKGPLGAEAW